jgi:hypothetical protein
VELSCSDFSLKKYDMKASKYNKSNFAFTVCVCGRSSGKHKLYPYYTLLQSAEMNNILLII